MSCPHCDRKFSRPSHLTRHISSHLPQNKRDHVTCSKCGKKFARNDVLLRHLRISHHITPLGPRSAQRSCYRCAEKKLKCDRSNPCHGCTRSQTACSYPVVRDSQATCLPSPSLQDRALLDPEVDPHERSVDLADGEWLPEVEAAGSPQVQHAITEFATHFNNSTASINSNGDMTCYDTADHHGVLAGTLFPHSTSMNTSVGVDYDDAMFLEREGAALRPEIAPGASQSSFSTMPFGSLTRDWLNFEPFGSIDDFYDVLPSNATSSVPLPHHATWSMPNPIQIQPPISRDQQPPTLSVGGNMSTNMLTKTALPNVQSHSQPWPFEQAHDAIPSTLQLPPLRDMLRGSGRAHGLGKTTMEAVAQLLSGPVLPNVDELSADFNATAAFHLLRRAVDSFFGHFCAILPIIHVPTWDMFTTPTALIAAMACIGSTFEDCSDAWENSLLLSEICSRVIVWLVC